MIGGNQIVRLRLKCGNSIHQLHTGGVKAEIEHGRSIQLDVFHAKSMGNSTLLEYPQKTDTFLLTSKMSIDFHATWTGMKFGTILGSRILKTLLTLTSFHGIALRL